MNRADALLTLACVPGLSPHRRQALLDGDDDVHEPAAATCAAG